MKSLIVGVLLAMSANLSAQAAASGRVVLPDSIYPVHYAVDIVPDAAHLRFNGRVAIELEVGVSAPVIVLNAAELVFDRVALSGRSDVPQVNFDPARETASIAFAQPLVPGKYRLEIDYHGKINQQASGLFALDYTVADQSKKRALYTQFENSDARRFIPCWDEPGIKSTFTLSLDVRADEMAVSNMPIESSVPSAGGLKHVRFAATPKMSVYLLFAGIGDFERVHRMVGKTDVGIVVKRGDAARTAFALDAAAQLLPYYNDYFAVPFPLPKLDIIAAPGGSGFFSAMENWGALLHFEHAVLVDPRFSTQVDQQRVYVVIAHEMAHQWFGDLVTMAWWDDLWLNEGFASWMENKAADRFHPDWKIWLQEQSHRQRAMRTDASIGTHPIITPIKDVLEASGAFDDITYIKGSSVIRMLEAYVGEDAFRAGVRSYMKAFAYRNAVSDDLWKHIDAAGGKKITDIAHDFTLQAGVPLIFVSDVHCVQGKQVLSLLQTRFAVDESGKRGVQTWRVPVQFGTLTDNAVASTVVRGKAPTQAGIAGCKPVLVNPGQPGYYRTRYDAASAAALAARFRALAAEDQLGLLENAAALAFVGQAPLHDYLALTRTLPPAADPIVWRSVAEQLSEIDQLLDGQTGQAASRAFARALLQLVFDPLGWDVIPGESDNAALLRSALIAVLGQIDDPAIVAEGAKRFSQFTRQPDSVSAAVRKAALNIAAMHADAGQWDRLRAFAKAASTEVERGDFYVWLGSSADAKLAQRTLDLALTEEAPVTLRTRLIRAVAVRHPELATDFAISHWEQIAPLLAADSRFEFVPRLAGRSSDQHTIERLNRFVQPQFPTAARNAVEKAVGEVRYRAQLKDRLIEAVAHDEFAARADDSSMSRSGKFSIDKR